jgi:hypothetical protein
MALEGRVATGAEVLAEARLDFQTAAMELLEAAAAGAVQMRVSER